MSNDIKPSARLESLDALRGFDMFFIMGGAGLITAICSLCGSPDGWLAQQMSHVAWHGLRHHDTIFPLFLFIAGVTFPFSYAKQVERGFSKLRISLNVLRRGFLLFLFGLAYSGMLNFEWSHLRVWSVLGRIGLAWMGAALIFLFLEKRLKTRIIIAASILLVYALINRFCVAPDFPTADPFSVEGSITCWLDRTLWPNHIYKKLYDPEGFLGIFPAIVTASLGVFSGEWLRRAGVTPERKAAGLGIAAVGLGILAWLMSYLMPINKALWSSSFVLAVGCYSTAMLALFYWIIDVKSWRKWDLFFKVIGMNAITIYLTQRIVNMGGINNFFFHGLATLVPSSYETLVMRLGYIAVCWAFLYFLYRRKIFLKV